jgi:hypothetical protein
MGIWLSDSCQKSVDVVKLAIACGRFEIGLLHPKNTQRTMIVRKINKLMRMITALPMLHLAPFFALVPKSCLSDSGSSGVCSVSLCSRDF